jgi:hypothetical protein
MAKATISKRVLDTLIRAKLARLDNCARIEPLPVAWHRRDRRGCNWEIPGWTGESRRVDDCLRQLHDYLHFLSEQFDVPEER